MAAILGKDYVELKVDTDRMAGGKALAMKLRGMQGGIPWMVILDDKGKRLTTSDGPQGNAGYPAEPEEIAHFMEMLKATKQRITAEELQAVEATLKKNAEQILGRRQRR